MKYARESGDEHLPGWLRATCFVGSENESEPSRADQQQRWHDGDDFEVEL